MRALLASMVVIGFAAPAFHSLSAKQSFSPLQIELEHTMRGHAGAFVMVDVVSGHVIAAVHQEIAAQTVESPGSTLKPFVLMALLDSGRIDSQERLVCRRTLTIGGVPMDCTHPASVKLLDSEEAIAYSCNSYVAAAAARLNPDELVQALRRAGLNQATGLVDGEAVGHVDRPANRDALQLEALGTRGVEVTPLGLLEAYRMLALKRRGGDSVRDASVFSGLVDSVDYGMAHAAYVSEMKVAGKTGTASARHSRQTHGFFAGYAPADQPEIAMVVYLEQGRGLDAAAAAQPVLAAFAHNRHAP